MHLYRIAVIILDSRSFTEIQHPVVTHAIVRTYLYGIHSGAGQRLFLVFNQLEIGCGKSQRAPYPMTSYDTSFLPVRVRQQMHGLANIALFADQFADTGRTDGLPFGGKPGSR